MPEPSKAGGGAYLLVALPLVAYVALCAPNWDVIAEADAWEHHRAVRVLARQPWRPGNPTYATPEPSIRYSPYSMALALASRATGVDPFAMICAAAVANTALIAWGLYAFLGAYGHRAASASALVVIVSLWGGPPHYANSTAMADLSWHQMNPSAFAMGLSLLIWAAARSRRPGRGAAARALHLSVMGAAGAAATLSHGMTGCFGFLVLFVLALVAPADRRTGQLVDFAATAAIAGALCLAWPWFDFLDAAIHPKDVEYWFNPYILRAALLEWCAPAMALAVVALPYHREELIRGCLIAATACFALAIASFVVRSPILARLPMPATFLLQVAIGVFVHRTGLLRPSTWPARIRGLARGESAGGPAAEVLTAAMLLYLLAPQVVAILRDPSLARPYIARLAHLQKKGRHLKPEYDRILEPIGERDVVLAEPTTAWAVPSSRGRIVAATHYELFTPDQPRRDRDVRAFFGNADAADRGRILGQYDVKYILLDPDRLDRRVFEDLLEPSAVVRQDDRMVLLDAGRWRAARSDRDRAGAGARARR